MVFPGPHHEMYEQNFPPELFINRELSWLEFNARVLEEAEDPRTPLLERVKFLAIFSSNLDEFFMVRVAGLREQAFGDGAPQDYSPDGLRALAQLQRITKRTQELVAAQYRCWNDSVRPALAAEGIRLLAPHELNADQQIAVDRFFRERALPILTPMAVDPAHPSPRYHNRGLYLAAMLDRRRGLGPKQLFAVVQVPQVLPRLVPVGSGDDAQFILLEDLVSARLPELFGGFDVLSWTTFRITRDSDIDLLEQESDDMLRLIEDRLKTRQRGEAVRLEVAAGGSEDLSRMIIDEEAIRDNQPEGYSEVYRIPGPLDLTAMMELIKLADREQLRDPPFSPQMPRGLRRRDDLFATDRPPRYSAASSVRLVRCRGRFCHQSGERSEGAGHQANALPHQRRFADYAGPHPGRRQRQARHGAGGVESAVRRSQQRFVGAATRTGRRARGIRFPRLENALQALAGCAARRQHAETIRASGHRQLQPDDRIGLHRFGIVHR